MKTDATKPSELVQYWKDSDKEDNEISKKVSDENICNISSDFSLTDGFILIWLLSIDTPITRSMSWVIFRIYKICHKEYKDCTDRWVHWWSAGNDRD